MTERQMKKISNNFLLVMLQANIDIYKDKEYRDSPKRSIENFETIIHGFTKQEYYLSGQRVILQ